MSGGGKTNARFNPHTSAPTDLPYENLTPTDDDDSWLTVLNGQSSHEPAIVDGTVYIGTIGGPVGSSKLRAYAISAETGAIEWRFTPDDGLKGTPAVTEDSVYFTAFDGMVYALNRDDGTERWRVDIGSSVKSGPTLAEDLLLVGTKAGELHALDPEHGDEQWQATAPDVVNHRAAVTRSTVIVGNDSGIVAIDLEDGTELWRFETNDKAGRDPVIYDGTVYVTCKDEHLYAVDLGDGTQKWRAPTNDDTIWTSPAVAYGRVYLGTPTVRAFDAADGSELWRTDIEGETPAVTSNTLYVPAGRKIYALDPADGSVRGEMEPHTNRQHGHEGSPPAVADGLLCFARDGRDGEAYLYGIR